MIQLIKKNQRKNRKNLRIILGPNLIRYPYKN